MKLTKRQLQKLIKEELSKVLNEEERPMRPDPAVEEIFRRVRLTLQKIANLTEDIINGPLTTDKSSSDIKGWYNDVVGKAGYLRLLSEKLKEREDEEAGPPVDAVGTRIPGDGQPV